MRRNPSSRLDARSSPTSKRWSIIIPKENPRAVAGRSDAGENGATARTLSVTLQGGSKMRGTKNINSTGECLLRGANFLPESDPSSFEQSELA